MKTLRPRDPVARLALSAGIWSIALTLAIEAIGWLAELPAPAAQWHTQWEQLAGRGLLIVAWLYGALRAMRFHPALDKAYRDWLKLTPWRPGQALPLGSIPLNWADAALFAAWGAFTRYHLHGEALWPAMAAVAAYVITSLPGLAKMGRWEALVILWAAAALPLYGSDIWRLALMCGVLYLVAWRGTVKGLRGFPWEPERPWQRSLGVWPWRQIGPVREPKSRRAFLGACAVICATAAWCAGCFTATFDPQVVGAKVLHDKVLLLCMSGGLLCAVARLGIYAIGRRPPISFWGRIVKGRWIIPGYDRIFPAPLAVAAASAALGAALHHLQASPSIMAGVFTAVVPMLALTLPPTLRNWRLTGQYHVARAVGKPLAPASLIR